MELEEFREYLFLDVKDVDEELNEFVWSEGESRVSGWLTSIFEDWEEIAKPLPHKRQNVVLWRICGEPLWIGWWLKGSVLSHEEKYALLDAAKVVTQAVPKLFGPSEPMENGYFMWWDLLASDIIDPPVAKACLDILAELSRHPDDRVQYAALHGLGHLQHPERPAVIDQYVQFHPAAKGDPWILQCREGTVM